MTSVLRRYAQLEPRTQYFSVFSDVSGYTLVEGANSSPVMTIAAFNAAFSPTYTGGTSFQAGFLLKDLGRQVTVYTTSPPGSAHVAVFRQVMQVNGPVGNEGVSNTATNNIAYICTWEDGSGTYQAAYVARTG